MPAKSQAQRRLLNARFGHAWVKAHGFDNKGKLPARLKKKGKAVRKKGKKKATGRKKMVAKRGKKSKVRRRRSMY